MRQRLDRPQPRVALGRALAGVAHAGIDVSDGLLADLGHVAAASAVAIDIELECLPASPALCALDAPTRRHVQATGGDDYELCFTAAPSRRAAVEAAAADAGVAVTRIGRVRAGEGVHALDADGQPWTPKRAGHVHFG